MPGQTGLEETVDHVGELEKGYLGCGLRWQALVLMDLPVTWHVEYWIGQGATVSMALTPLENVTGKLMLAAFAVDRSPGFRFLSVGGEAGVSILVERIRRRHGDNVVIGGDVLRDVVTNLNLVLGHVFACWHCLDQDAVE